MAAQTSAANRYASPIPIAANLEVDAAYATTTAVPATVANQKSGLGREPVRIAPKTAVRAGRIPITTEPWLALRVRSASALNHPKPTAAPAATTRTLGSWARLGHGARTATR